MAQRPTPTHHTTAVHCIETMHCDTQTPASQMSSNHYTDIILNSLDRPKKQAEKLKSC